MVKQRTWILAGAGVLIGITIWGWSGAGRASELLVETPADIGEPVSFEEDREGGSGIEGQRKYDSILYVRSQPLSDPFRLEKREQPVNEQLLLTNTINAVPVATSVAPESLPLLRGIFITSGERRALLEWRGTTKAVKEGESLGAWTVGTIKKEEIKLYGEGEPILLRMRP